ncbi:hypothetical protein FJT64_000675 [Amphibalanus amphitrite]|uniref:Uncharacterized protein n=1 Tax=Amphibalanus amphitrite TaxID=1232801 RepID=A0A6A4VZB0_AMPAM|nr:hypothetical protein FJT64_000675 [Amphibalanus amphitrite]
MLIVHTRLLEKVIFRSLATHRSLPIESILPTKSRSPPAFSVSPLSVSSLVRHPSRPLTAAETSDCLRRRGAALGRSTRITFIGNSRARQVFETLAGQRRLRLLTRAQTAGRAPFLDEPLLPDWHHFAEPNSTCVGVWPKGRPKGEPARAWCSQLAVGDGLELEFRWRNAMFRFLDVLRRLERGCARGLPCPDFIVINQGLHFVVNGRFGRLMPIFREYLEDCVPYLRRLTARRVKVLWMLEHAGNPRIGPESYNDDLTVLNALLADMFIRRLRLPGLHVWTSEASAVARFWSRECFWRLPELSQEDRHVCMQERYHVNNGTLEVMAQQLINFVCDSDDYN